MARLKDKIFDDIEERLDELESLLKAQVHLSDPDRVEEVCSKLGKYWHLLDDEAQDYIHGARYAIEEKMKWNV